MLNYNIYTLEDMNEYSEADSLIFNDNKYLLLSQIDNESNICIRKVVNNDGENYFYRLKGFEFEEVFNEFAIKNMNLFE